MQKSSAANKRLKGGLLSFAFVVFVYFMIFIFLFFSFLFFFFQEITKIKKSTPQSSKLQTLR